MFLYIYFSAPERHGYHINRPQNFPLQHTATLQHTAKCCNTLQHTVNVVQRIATHCNHTAPKTHGPHTTGPPNACLQHSATLQNCNTLQHTETHCNTLQHCQHTVNTLQHTATLLTHCNTLQHTATHCNTLQHTAPERHGHRTTGPPPASPRGHITHTHECVCITHTHEHSQHTGAITHVPDPRLHTPHTPHFCTSSVTSTLQSSRALTVMGGRHRGGGRGVGEVTPTTRHVWQVVA